MSAITGQNHEMVHFAAPLTACLTLKPTGPVVLRESVTVADLFELFGEVWRDSILRRGFPEVGFEEAAPAVLPVLSKTHRDRCSDIEVQVTDPTGRRHRRSFDIVTLDAAARRGVQHLIVRGILKTGDRYYYHIGAGEPSSACMTPDTPSANSGMNVQVRRAPMRFLRVPLAELQAGATSVADSGADEFPVFYTCGALEESARYARRGASHRPPVETGAVLLGCLCSCPVTGELSVVIHDVIDVRAAEEKRFSLSYSSRTWQRLQTIVRARQTQTGGAAVRIVGQAHGHNFLPGDEELESEGGEERIPGETSVFISQDDRVWSRSVFHGQPWQLCHIFGLTRRAEPVNALFGLSGGSLVERGYSVIDEFDPARWS